MIHYPKRLQVLAASLSALAGYVDALGFLKLGGFFVSFMSGNSTRMSVGIVEKTSDAAIAGSLIALFVVGVMSGSLVGHKAGQRRRPAVLAAVALLLTVAAVSEHLALGALAVAALALAMGAENAVFDRDGEVSIGLTYMTGTLVKFGQRLAHSVMGGDRWAWLPYLVLWAGLALGASAGAYVYNTLGFETGISIAAFVSIVFAVLAIWL